MSNNNQEKKECEECENIEDIKCPHCGFYCLGKGGKFCVDKLRMYECHQTKCHSPQEEVSQSFDYDGSKLVKVSKMFPQEETKEEKCKFGWNHLAKDCDCHGCHGEWNNLIGDLRVAFPEIYGVKHQEFADKFLKEKILSLITKAREESRKAVVEEVKEKIMKSFDSAGGLGGRRHLEIIIDQALASFNPKQEE